MPAQLRDKIGAFALCGAVVGSAVVGSAVVGSAVVSCRDAIPERTTLTIYAASSLTDVFATLEREFEQIYPAVDVRFSFAGSQTLRTQIEAGARADIFASADESHLVGLTRAGLIADYGAFAENELVVIVPADGPATVTSFADLSKPLRLIVGSPQVPIGMYTNKLFEQAENYGAPGFGQALRKNIVSTESNVRFLRAKVSLGEADAAIVYRTDAASSARVRAIEIPAELNQRVRYFIGVVSGALSAPLARRWVAFVRSPAGAQALRNHGFLMTRAP